jgi:phage replication O-like protein O
MANPQRENGYTPIANEILDELIKAGLSGRQLSVILLLLRKTYGFNKKQDSISLSQFVKLTRIPKSTLCRILNSLQLVSILTLVKKGNSKKNSNVWTFNKNYEQWKLVPKQLVVKMGLVDTKNGTSSDQKADQLVPFEPVVQMGHTIDNVLLEESTSNPSTLRVEEPLRPSGASGRPTTLTPDLPKVADQPSTPPRPRATSAPAAPGENPALGETGHEVLAAAAGPAGSAETGLDIFNALKDQLDKPLKINKSDPCINAMINALQKNLGSIPLDGTAQDNRIYAGKLYREKILKVFKKNGIEFPTPEEVANSIFSLLESANKYQAMRMTNFKYIYYNFAEIINNKNPMVKNKEKKTIGYINL